MEKDFQDIQQLDSEENNGQLSGEEEPGAPAPRPRTERPFWKGKLLLAALPPWLAHAAYRPQTMSPGVAPPLMGWALPIHRQLRACSQSFLSWVSLSWMTLATSR